MYFFILRLGLESVPGSSGSPAENNMHHIDIMKAITKSYLIKGECYVPKAICHILPGSKLRKNFPVVYFADTNLQEERVPILL